MYSIFEGERRPLDLGQQPRLRVHLAYEVVHLGQDLGRLVHDQVEPVGQHFELRVGDEHRELDDLVSLQVEAGHLEIDPHEAIVDTALGLGHGDHATVQLAIRLLRTTNR
jgi:hypothetical protein